MVSQSIEPLLPSSQPASGDDENIRPQRKQRRDKGLIRLTPRDLEVLCWIGEQYTVRLDSLQVLLGRLAQQTTNVENQITESSARRVLDRWKQEQLVKGEKILAKEPEWVWLTPYGLRQMNLPYKPNSDKPPPGHLYHRHLVNHIRLHTESKYPQFHWRSERQIRYERGSDKEFHIPDGEVVVEDEKVIAVEVERTQKSRPKLGLIVKRLAQQYEMIWYFVTPETRPVVQLATALYGDQFSLNDLADFVK